jgi:RNA recognition motif-containing protein
LRDHFSQYGEVVFARVILDRETRRSKWFGFVEFAHPEDAAKAQAATNETELAGRTIRVDFAKEDPEKLQARQESHSAASSMENLDDGAEDL